MASRLDITYIFFPVSSRTTDVRTSVVSPLPPHNPCPSLPHICSNDDRRRLAATLCVTTMILKTECDGTRIGGSPSFMKRTTLIVMAISAVKVASGFASTRSSSTSNVNVIFNLHSHPSFYQRRHLRQPWKAKILSIQLDDGIDEDDMDDSLPVLIKPDTSSDDDDDTTTLDGENESIINGTSEGMIVTKQYTVSLEGFSQESDNSEAVSISDVFTPDDQQRLRLQSKNVTLPAALMLLDPETYPTQSRARKSIRQRAICISRYDVNEPNANPVFKQLGKVITRVYPGDTIGFQRRAGSDYYALQGVPYRLPPFEVPVVYEDDHMAIVNKPSGVVLYRAEGGRGGGARGGGHGRDTLLSALPYVLKPSNASNIIDQSRSVDEDTPQNVPLKRPQPVHRLDRPTSGLVVVAKTKLAAVHLSQQFEFRKAEKTYVAIVNGIPRQSGVRAEPMQWNTIDYDLEEKTAVTRWRVLRKVKSLHGNDGTLTLVEMKPKVRLCNSFLPYEDSRLKYCSVHRLRLLTMHLIALDGTLPSIKETLRLGL